MTVSITSRKAGPFLGNGVATSFPFTFKVFTRADLRLLHIDAAGIVSELALDTDYTVTLNADQDTSPGGTITYPAAGTALPVGEQLVGLGGLAAEQGTDLTNLGRFLPQSFENALDYAVILIQQLEEELGRTLKFAVGAEVSSEIPSVQARALKFLGFDETGAPVAATQLTGTTSDEVIVTATEGQTVFNTTPLTYLPGAKTLLVEADGLELAVGDDYTETSANSVTLVSGVAAGTVLKFRAAGTPISMGVFGTSVRYTPTGDNPRADSIQSVLRKVVKRPQDNGDVLGDATAACQNAINALEASGSELLELDIGDLALRIDGELTFTQPIQIRGQGVYDIDNARGITRPARGSWFIHNGSGPLFRVNQATSKGASIERIGIFQTGHPDPGPGWAPAVKDWVIRNENTQGTLHLDRVHFHNVYDGILCDEAHRPKFSNITGQFFHRGVKFDRIYDEGTVDGFRGWTYWSEHDNVLGWMQANGRLVTLGRVDGMHFGGRLFGFALADVLYFGAGAVAGGARVITVADIYADFCKRAVAVDNGVTHTTIHSLFHLGQAWPAIPTSAVPGSCAVEILSGSNSLVQVTNYYGVLSDAASLKISGGTSNQIWVESPLFEQYDFGATGSGPVDPGPLADANQVYLGDVAHAVNYAGASTPLVTRAGSAVLRATLAQQFVGGAAFNRLIGAANASGQLAVLTTEGDADAGVAVLAKTNGIVQVGSAANKLGFYGGAAVVKGSITGSRAGNAALASLLTYLADRGLLTDGTTA